MSKKVLTLKKQSVILLMHFKKSAKIIKKMFFEN